MIFIAQLIFCNCFVTVALTFFSLGRSDITISPSTFPKREITKECPHKNEIFDVVIDVVEDLVEEKDFRVSMFVFKLKTRG